MRPKDIAPKIYDLSKKKNYSVQKALHNNYWISPWTLITTSRSTIATLWEKLTPHPPQLRHGRFYLLGIHERWPIHWASAYNTPFLGFAWHRHAPARVEELGRPKCKFFAWLVINNRILTADRLQRRGWPNCHLCPLLQACPGIGGSSSFSMSLHCQSLGHDQNLAWSPWCASLWFGRCGYR